MQDLTFWLPLMVVGAWWLWRDRDWGHVIIGPMLAMWVLESITIASDQIMAQNADPGSTVAPRPARGCSARWQ